VLSEVGAELSFQLPMASSAAFPALFTALETGSASLGIENYGVSVTTLEEVFMKVGIRTHLQCSCLFSLSRSHSSHSHSHSHCHPRRNEVSRA
jgi:hypothetical protein